MLSAYAVIGREGVDVPFHCHSNIPWYNVFAWESFKWFNEDGKEIYDIRTSSSCFRCSGTLNDGVHTLYLRNITKADEGWYECRQEFDPVQKTHLRVIGEFSIKHCNCQNKYHLLQVS